MKKSIIFAAIAAVVLTSCAKTHDTHQYTSPGDAISFGVYTNRTATKVNDTFGDITTANIKTSTDGFGVFAYYTQNTAWASASSTAKPNFMYNQQVYWKSDMTAAEQEKYVTKWYYTPLKYWPNGQNSTEVESGTINDKVTFFAYAPQIANASLNTVPNANEGITNMSANNDTGVPTLDFTVPAKVEEQIDLLWAIPQIDRSKQDIDQHVDFTFKHALSKLDVYVQAVVDQVAPTSSHLDAPNTKIILESLTITAKGVKSGTLALDSDTATPNWSGKTGDIGIVYDGSTWTEYDKSTTYGGKTGLSVTETKTQISAVSSPMIIPATLTAGNFIVSANYWVVTYDDALDGDYSVVQNVIKKTNTSNFIVTAGNKYDVTVRFGLTSISFDVVEVTTWGDGTDPDVDLPINTD